MRLSASTLGRGERECIGLALELDAEAVIDELRGRRRALTMGVRVVGTLGVLLLAKDEGLIQNIGPDVDALLETGFYLAPWLIADALATAGESD